LPSTTPKVSFPSCQLNSPEVVPLQTSQASPSITSPLAPGPENEAIASISTSRKLAQQVGTFELWSGSTETPIPAPPTPLPSIAIAIEGRTPKDQMKHRGQSAAFLKALRKKHGLGEFQKVSKRRARQTTRKVRTPIRRTYFSRQYVLPKMGL